MDEVCQVRDEVRGGGVGLLCYFNEDGLEQWGDTYYEDSCWNIGSLGPNCFTLIHLDFFCNPLLVLWVLF